MAKKKEVNKKSDTIRWAGDYSTPEITDLINYYFDRLKWTVILLRNMMYVLYPDENRLYNYENEQPNSTPMDISFDGLLRRLESEVCKPIAGYKEQLNTIIQIKIKEIEKLLLLDENFLTHYNKFKTDLLPTEIYSEEISTAHNLFYYKTLPLTDNIPVSFNTGTFETFYNTIQTSLREGENRINDLFPQRAVDVIPSQDKGTVNKYFQFDNREIETYIYHDKLEAFYNIEKALFDEKYLSSEGKWNTFKRRLVAFILVLRELGYMHRIFSNKTEDNSLNYTRAYFERRYTTDIKQQIKPTKFDFKKLHIYHPDFINIIPEIDSIKK